MRLSELTGCLPFYEIKGPESDPEILKVCHHHQDVEPGSLFTAIKGEKSDGRFYIDKAIEKGAAAVLSDTEYDLSVPLIIVRQPRHALAYIANHFYDYPSFDLNVIGVTGTNGKTTVTHMVQSILESQGLKTGIIGTLYMKQGDRVMKAENTTPDSLLLQQTLSDFRAEGVQAAVLEASSHGLAQGRMYGCDVDIAIFTNLTQDHLDYHETMEHYKWSKTLLFSQLGHAHMKNLPKFAVLNHDDPFSGEIAAATSAHIITYGLTPEADIYAENIIQYKESTSFTLCTPYGKADIQLKLAGLFNVYNALAAAAAGFVKRIPIEFIVKGLENLTGVPGRFEIVKHDGSFTVIVDYAHTPDSLQNILQAANKMNPEKLTVIVGCGGDRDRAKRPVMARIACQFADHAIFTSDNPRSEDPKKILRDMEKGVHGQQYTSIEDRRAAIRYAINNASAGEIIIIAGKGHEKYQIIKNEKIPFDDKSVAESFLNKSQLENGVDLPN
ncbi:UDP-N-acetylmuramoyl-L-alanyl-D-glutamate--2,6-diaminopimelate ligase [Jeotgalibacillus haloalkalitolerans]|uniref:UDP-N-acetylmuramoyl-L-alanyl-D-glutamate--2,6-diaminopimelate ligase n=1 Tax=Jeotgalibacillus haloalkalitolerans TaxID=3104292 RepID=A0ABU5KKV2_9BACL|nr:UDP-N-acetylmuramoyl-L-alanyl-D-glutamate--2,6-diaminopimelate ligase [Jeotgalibacillus sp. HH7-29]MDZ5711566.1 UDP-N-acetylmuramoyl-L-alanyl-D-glutamate--2,6-diaminopimelate ligase [Jeotgalibacillus sp. HH7-29]